MKVSADIQPDFINSQFVAYASSNPALVPDNLYLNNAIVDVNFDRNIMGLMFTNKDRGTEKTDLSRDRLITAPHLLFLNIR